MNIVNTVHKVGLHTHEIIRLEGTERSPHFSQKGVFKKNFWRDQGSKTMLIYAGMQLMPRKSQSD